MNENELIEAFTASIKNHEKCSGQEEKKRGFAYKFKYCIWFFLLLLFSPRVAEKGETFAACMTPVNERRIREFRPTGNLYRFAKLNASVSSVRKNISVVSGKNRLERMRVLSRGIRFFFAHKEELSGYFHFALEYYAIAVFLHEMNFREYVTPGMYERYCTLFSYLGRANGVKLVGVQDGAAVSIDVPSKVFCDEMNCFDAFEESIIRGFIKNSDCKFVYTGFQSVLTWSKFEKTDKRVLAIASQDWFTNKTIDLVRAIMQSPLTETWEIILFPHYRESAEDFEETRKEFPELIIEPKKRFENIDLLITFYSTIVYDFWSVNKDLQVFCLHIPGYAPGYYSRDNVRVFDRPEQLISAIYEES